MGGGQEYETKDGMGGDGAPPFVVQPCPERESQGTGQKVCPFLSERLLADLANPASEEHLVARVLPHSRPPRLAPRPDSSGWETRKQGCTARRIPSFAGTPASLIAPDLHCRSSTRWLSTRAIFYPLECY